MSRTSKATADDDRTIERGLEQSTALRVIDDNMPTTVPERTWDERLAGPTAALDHVERLPAEQRWDAIERVDYVDDVNEEQRLALERTVTSFAEACELTTDEEAACSREEWLDRPEEHRWLDGRKTKPKKLSTMFLSPDLFEERFDVLSEMKQNRRREKLRRVLAPSSPLFSSYLSLIVDHEIPEAKVVCDVASRTTCDVAEVFALTREGMRQLRARNEPARLSFYQSEVGRMADHVQRRWSETHGSSLGDKHVHPYHVNAKIQKFLGDCDIYDEQRGVLVELNNKLTSEVRGALARRYPHVSELRKWRDEPEPRTAGGKLSPPKPTHASFDKVFVLSPEARENKNAVYAAHVADCEQRGATPLKRQTFFGELRKWSGGRIRDSKPRGEDGRERFLVGVALL